MRPRVIPAENAGASIAGRSCSGCFNEAAGNPRGKQRFKVAIKTTVRRFNEAAGNPRGKLAGPTPRCLLPSLLQ